MKKILNHLKRNSAIYLILLVCLIVIAIAVFHDGQKDLKTVDTSLFKVVKVNEVKDMLKDKTPKFLVISKYDDQATVKYVQTLQYSIGSVHNKVYYLELADLKKDEEEELNEILNIDYILGEEKTTVKEMLNTLPLNIIIKNKRIEYAYAGPMNVSTLEALVKAYGIGE